MSHGSFIWGSPSLKDVLDQLDEGVYVVDNRRVIHYWNAAAARISGYSAEQVVGRSCRDRLLNHVDETGKCLCRDACPLVHTMRDGEPRQADVFLHHSDGHRVPVHVRGMPLRNDRQEVIGAVEVFRDMSEHAALAERLEQLETMAFVDPLTRLANRRYLEASLREKVAEAKRMHWGLAMAVIDIDQFKRFNDDYSHDFGDRVIRMVARTLSTNTRPYDIVARWGGDEFVIVLVNTNAILAERLLRRLVALIATSRLDLADRSVQATVSAGATMVDTYESMSDTFARADRLLYEAKQAGRNRVVTDAPELAAAG